MSQFPILSASVITSAHLPFYAMFSPAALADGGGRVERPFSHRCCHGNSQSVPGKDLQVCPLHSCQAPVVQTQIHKHTHSLTYIYILVYTDTNTCCLDFLLSITCAPHCEMQYALCNMSYGICLLHFDNILELSGIFNRHRQSMTFIMPRLRYVEHF